MADNGEFVRYIRKMMFETMYSEMAIETMYGYLNYHLGILSQAIEENNVDEVAFQKEQLEKVRVRLSELEYFNFNYK